MMKQLISPVNYILKKKSIRLVIWGCVSQRQVTDQELITLLVTVLLGKSKWGIMGPISATKAWSQPSWQVFPPPPPPRPSASLVTNWLPGNQVSSTSAAEPAGSASPHQPPWIPGDLGNGIYNEILIVALYLIFFSVCTSSR